MARQILLVHTCDTGDDCKCGGNDDACGCKWTERGVCGVCGAQELLIDQETYERYTPSKAMLEARRNVMGTHPLDGFVYHDEDT